MKGDMLKTRSQASPWTIIASTLTARCRWPVLTVFCDSLGNNESLRSKYQSWLQMHFQFCSKWSARMFMEIFLRLPAVQTQRSGQPWLDFIGVGGMDSLGDPALEGNMSSMRKGQGIHEASSCSQAVHRCRLPTLGEMIGGFDWGLRRPAQGMLCGKIWGNQAHGFDWPELGSEDYVIYFVSSLKNIKEHRS